MDTPFLRNNTIVADAFAIVDVAFDGLHLKRVIRFVY